MTRSSSRGWRGPASWSSPSPAAGGRVTIHGDYDVDGVCSTAILVSALRSLGARCDWLIPDRLADGYGLTPAGVEELRRRGSELVITVDCGIGSAEEVRALRRSGIEVLVTDHHQPPREELPDCPILHPVVSAYPFEGLCAAGVAQKLATALRSAAGERRVETVGGSRGPADRDLDLVALATVADLVPLVGENRRLVREGLRRAARRAPPGPARPDGGGRGRSRDGRRGGARLPARSADQRRRAALSSRRRGRADADRGSRAGGPDRRRARPRQRRAPPGRAPGGRGRRAGASGAQPRAARRPGAGARGRGLASGRGRDRRLPARREPPAPGGPALARRGPGEGVRAEHPRLRPAGGARCLLGAPGPPRRPSRRRRARARGGSPRSTSAPPSSSMPPRRSIRPTWSGPSSSMPWSGWGGRASAWIWPSSSSASARSARATPAPGCWSPRGACARCGRWARRESTPASSSRAAPAARWGSPSG